MPHPMSCRSVAALLSLIVSSTAFLSLPIARESRWRKPAGRTAVNFEASQSSSGSSSISWYIKVRFKCARIIMMCAPYIGGVQLDLSCTLLFLYVVCVHEVLTFVATL